MTPNTEQPVPSPAPNTIGEDIESEILQLQKQKLQLEVSALVTQSGLSFWRKRENHALFWTVLLTGLGLFTGWITGFFDVAFQRIQLGKERIEIEQFKIDNNKRELETNKHLYEQELASFNSEKAALDNEVGQLQDRAQKLRKSEEDLTEKRRQFLRDKDAHEAALKEHTASIDNLKRQVEEMALKEALLNSTIRQLEDAAPLTRVQAYLDELDAPGQTYTGSSIATALLNTIAHPDNENEIMAISEEGDRTTNTQKRAVLNFLCWKATNNEKYINSIIESMDETKDNSSILDILMKVPLDTASATHITAKCLSYFASFFEADRSRKVDGSFPYFLAYLRRKSIVIDLVQLVTVHHKEIELAKSRSILEEYLLEARTDGEGLQQVSMTGITFERSGSVLSGGRLRTYTIPDLYFYWFVDAHRTLSSPEDTMCLIRGIIMSKKYDFQIIETFKSKGLNKHLYEDGRDLLRIVSQLGAEIGKESRCSVPPHSIEIREWTNWVEENPKCCP